MKTNRGFTLIEILVVLIVVSLLMAMAAGVTRTLQASAQNSKSTTAIRAADEAIVNLVTVVRRLPCPADGSKLPSDGAYGLEQRDVTGDCLNNQVNGVVPWRTLGITVTDVTDGYGDLLTYRAAAGLTRDEAMNLTACDPAGAQAATGAAPYQACSAACSNQAPLTATSTCTQPINVLLNRGIQVRSTTGFPFVLLADPITAYPPGAAYVVISHGSNRAGAFTQEGAIAGVLQPPGADELQNAATLPLAAYYVDQSINATPAAYFDDVMVRPTIMQVVGRASLGPRTHN